MGLVPAAMAGSLRQTSSSAPMERAISSRKVSISRELEAGIDMQQREGNRAGIEGLLRQAQHDRGILADGVEHHGPLKFGGHFAQDVDALGLKQTEMAQALLARRGVGLR